MGLNASFWKGRRVLVTGHTGFKGGWLSLWLSSLGARVHGIALDPPTTPNLFSEAGVGASVEADYRVDIRDARAFSAVLEVASPEVVFHLAAQPLVLHSYREPIETFAVNVMGTAHLLQAALQCGSVKAAVVVTSDKCYRNVGQPNPFREEDPLGGADPYSASKACAELVAEAYRSSFCSAESDHPISVATVRAGNVIGGGDWGADRLVPDCIRALVGGGGIALRYPHAVRPWQHVLDPLAGYLMLAQRLLAGEHGKYATALNFGPDAEGCLPVSEIAGRIGALWGKPLDVRLAGRPAEKESPVLRLDSAKARSLLGWQPGWRIETALSETVAWYRAWQEGRDMHAYSLSQIGRYLSEGALRG